MQSSKLRLFSIGYVSKDKADGTSFIRVIPVETIPELDGVIQDENIDVQFTGLDGLGNSIEGKTTPTISIPAEWIGSDSQRMTSPDVKKGEIVYIYQYADEERYYWDSRNVRSSLRDKERVIYLFAAKMEGDKAHLDTENSYSLVFSSKDKVISLRMTEVGGEESGYLFQMDGANGQSTWMDTKGQQIFIDTKKNSIKMKNKDNSFIHLSKRNIFIDCLNDLSIKAKEKITVACNNLLVSAATDIKVDSPDILFTSEKVVVDSPITTFTGMLEAGPTTVASLSIKPSAPTMRARMLAAGIKSGGPICNIAGDTKVEGSMGITGTLDMNGGKIINCTMVKSLIMESGAFNKVP